MEDETKAKIAAAQAGGLLAAVAAEDQENQQPKMVNVVDLRLIAARTSHEVNRVWCRYNGDNSQASWEDAEQWQRDSAVAGVCELLANPGTTPAQQHSLWMAHKKAEGWVYGEEKDVETKTHPCLVPYDELPSEQKIKDEFFQAVVRAVLLEMMQAAVKV